MILACKNIDAEIIVIDNHSSDGSRVFFQNRFDKVHFIWNEENTGFAKANNQALRQAKGAYILFLNPDTLVPEDCMEKCIAFIRSKNNRCAIGVKMVDGTGTFLKESRRAFPDPVTSIYKLSGLTALFPRSQVFARYYLGHLDKNKVHETDVLSGAFIMAPHSILKEVNGFDESFFMYGEDVDLSYRIQQAGYQNFYFPDTTIIHFKGESTKKGSLNYVRMFYNAMSIFVKKHYGSSRAGVYNIFIQAGIGVRAFFSALSRFIKWVGLPALDALLILLSFWVVKSFWAAAVRPYIDFTSQMLWIAFPAFTVLFLITSYYSGLYDNGYQQSRLNSATIASTLVLFTVYALLPESAKFSRGILFFSILFAYLLITILRVVLYSSGIISKKKNINTPFIAIIGAENEAAPVLNIMRSTGKEDLVLGRIAVNTLPESNTLGNLGNMHTIFKTGLLKKLIYCQGTLSYRDIIASVQQLPHHVDAAFYTQDCHSIIESQDKQTTGKYLSSAEYFRLNNPLYRRSKRLLDVSTAILLLLTFPVHVILKNHRGKFFKNIFLIVLNRKSFIGYATANIGLPPLKTGLLSTTGLPASRNTLPVQALHHSDRMYALHYSVFTDLSLIWHNYRQL